MISLEELEREGSVASLEIPPSRGVRRSLAVRQNPELFLCAIIPTALVWTIFTALGLSATFGWIVISLVLFFASYSIVSYQRVGLLGMKDRLATSAVWVGAGLAFLPLLLILWTVFSAGLSVVAADFPHFLVADLSRAGADSPVTSAGVGNAIIGTFEQCGIASLVTVPLAILTALFLDEASRPDPSLGGRILNGVAQSIRVTIDAMNSIPSIITAIFIYLLWVQPHGVHGFSGVAASAALSIMMVPTVTSAAESVLRIVPGTLREASLAVGAPQWRTIVRVVLPAARAGLISGVILGIARIVGETAPTLFTAHGSPTFNVNPTSGGQANLALDIYQLILSPAPNAVREAWGTAVVLITLVGSLFLLARIVGSGSIRRLRRRIRARRPVSE